MNATIYYPILVHGDALEVDLTFALDLGNNHRAIFGVLTLHIIPSACGLQYVGVTIDDCHRLFLPVRKNYG